MKDTTHGSDTSGGDTGYKQMPINPTTLSCERGSNLSSVLGTTRPLVQGDLIPEELRELGRSWGSALIRTNLQPGSPG